MFLYTSGSTGTPKGVVLSHQSHIWVVETRLAPGLDRHRYLIAAPLYHMNALALAKLACAAHATIVLLPQFSAPAYIAAIGQLPLHLAHRGAADDRHDAARNRALSATDLSSVEFVRMGSAPVSASLMAALHEALPRAVGDQCLRHHRGRPGGIRPHPKGLPQPEFSVGYPHPQVSLRLVDGANRDAAQGVLEMKCPALMLGYHNRPDVAPPLTPDGFYITGDVFRRDADGFHYFVGRTDDMFVSGGENIYPADVERMLERHPDSRKPPWCRSRTTSRAKNRSPLSSESPAALSTARLSSVSPWPTPRPTSTRASSGSSTNCRSPRPTSSTARRCSDGAAKNIQGMKECAIVFLPLLPLPRGGEGVRVRKPNANILQAGGAFTVLPGHLHRSAMMHFSHSGRRAMQV